MNFYGWIIVMILLIVSLISGFFMLIKPVVITESDLDKAVLSPSVGGYILGSLLMALPIGLILVLKITDDYN